MSFDIEKEVAKFESVHNIEGYEKDTIFAVMMIKKNKSFIKSSVAEKNIKKRVTHATKLIKQAYPNADTNMIRRELFKIGIFTPFATFIFCCIAYALFSLGIIAGICNIANQMVDIIFVSALYLGISGFIFFIYTYELVEDL